MKIVDKILGESTPHFSAQFVGILNLMRSIDELVHNWWRYDLHDDASHSRWVVRLQLLIKDYEKRHGKSDLSKSLHAHIKSHKEDAESLDFWSQLQYILVLKTREGILSGKISVDDEDPVQKMALSGDIMNDPSLLTPEVLKAITRACKMIDEDEIKDIITKGRCYSLD